MSKKAKNLLPTDILLIPTFIGTVYSGLKLHEASHSGNYGDWVDFHIIFGFLMLILGIIHIIQHKNWYKNFFKRNKQTKILTNFFSILFASVVITGIVDIFDFEHITKVGSIHFRFGFIMSVIDRKSVV